MSAVTATGIIRSLPIAMARLLTDVFELQESPDRETALANTRRLRSTAEAALKVNAVASDLLRDAS